MTQWITPAELQVWIGPDLTNPDAATLATTLTDVVRGYLERDLELATFNEILDSLGTDYVLVSHWPIRTVSSVAINGEPPLAVAAFSRPGYQLDPVVTRKIRFPGRRVPRGISNVAVSYTAGYDFGQAVGSTTGPPGDLDMAMKLIAAAIYNAQAADPNLVSENTGGVFSGSFHQGGVGFIPPAAQGYLRRFRRVAP